MSGAERGGAALIAELEALRRDGWVSDLAVELARFVGRISGSSAPELLLAACLASQRVSDGHVCAELRAFVDEPASESEERLRPLLPTGLTAERWALALRRFAPIVGAPGDFSPLVLDRSHRLYLHRYWEYEREIAESLLRRAADGAAAPDVDEERMRADIARLFPKGAGGRHSPAPGPEEGGVDWQRVAAATAALRRLCVISGGPGTGKTTTVVRILALLARRGAEDDGRRTPRVGLAAPTGKAAARMQEAVRAAKQRLAGILDAGLLEAIPEAASTIHRLLGPRRGSVYFRHDRDHLLPLDVLVVDEASMVDVALLAKLLRALPLEARLILVGDKDQLASVEAGAVLGDVCTPAPGFSEAFRARAAALSGEAIPRPADEPSGGRVPEPRDESLGGGAAPDAPKPSPEASSPLASRLRDSIVLLERSYRFGPESGIGELARLVREGRAEDALALLASGRFADVGWKRIERAEELRRELLACAVDGFATYFALAREGGAPDKVFEAFNRFRVLCAVRRGDFGVERVNEHVARSLDEQGLIGGASEWYVGRPVMITRNDYQLGLFNGDVGIALARGESRIRVHFEPAEGRARVFPPVRLPRHEPVFAMTIHKSQGSEFERVVVVLPPEGSRILGRELLYTGITRARAKVEIWSSEASFVAAVGKPFARSSGLREALWGTGA